MDRPGTQGLMVVDKSAGWGSARVVAAVKSIWRSELAADPGLSDFPKNGRRFGPKVGHAGTLDPFATGVLVVMVGSATKRCEAVMSMPKGYDATVRLGATTPTLDPTSAEISNLGFQISDSATPTPPIVAAIETALVAMTGDVLQVPPVFSALKVSGRRSSDRARDGEAVAPQPRRVRIDRLEVLDYDWPTVRIRVACGRGTYVRAIARDLGDALGVGGYLTALTRTFVGPYTLERSVTIERLEADGVLRHLIETGG